MNSRNDHLLEKLQDRTGHLATFLAAAQQAAGEVLALVRQIGEERRGEVEAHCRQLADAEEKLNDVRRQLRRVMDEFEHMLPPPEDE